MPQTKKPRGKSQAAPSEDAQVKQPGVSPMPPISAEMKCRVEWDGERASIECENSTELALALSLIAESFGSIGQQPEVPELATKPATGEPIA